MCSIYKMEQSNNHMDPPRGPGDGGHPLNRDSEDDYTPLTVAFINCVGQSRLPISKQLEIQGYVSTHRIDILHLQECKMDDDTFSQCSFITSNFNLFSNNKPDDSFYGTATLVRSDLEVTNIHTDNNGRAIVFDAAGCTWGNLYLPSGVNSRAQREQYFSDIILAFLIRRLAQGAIGGTLNSIISLIDGNRNPQQKISPSCRNLARAFSWVDSFRALQPRALQYSRYSRNINQGHQG